jgi:hypothetical protein
VALRLRRRIKTGASLSLRLASSRVVESLHASPRATLDHSIEKSEASPACTFLIGARATAMPSAHGRSTDGSAVRRSGTRAGGWPIAASIRPIGTFALRCSALTHDARKVGGAEA